MPRLSANSCLRRLGELNIVEQRRPRSSIAYLCNSVLDDLLVGHITLVANQELVDALGGVAVNLLEPLLDVVE